MQVRYARFGDDAARQRLRCLEAGAQRLWDAVAAGTHDRVPELLREIDPRLGVHVPTDRDRTVEVHYAELGARVLAEAVVERAPEGWGARVGGGPRPLDVVLQTVREETNADLTEARARVGFTRGHLMEVVVSVPGQVGEDAQVAAELAIEGLLGDAFVDDWIAAVDVVPAPRGGLLQVVQPGAAGAETHPLGELPSLTSRAVRGLESSLPECVQAKRPPGAEWTMLEMEPTGGMAQGDRLLAGTCLPELLKCALEGLPFHSRRFSRFDERFGSLEIPAGSAGAEQRLARRRRLEDELDRELRRTGFGAVIGTGYGIGHDYVDLCLDGDDVAIETARRVARRADLPEDCRLRFFDSRWSEESIEFSSGAPSDAAGAGPR